MFFYICQKLVKKLLFCDVSIFVDIFRLLYLDINFITFIHFLTCLENIIQLLFQYLFNYWIYKAKSDLKCEMQLRSHLLHS